MSRYRDLAARLDDIGSDLDDLALDLLHAAMAAGAGARPHADKVLTQARRAVEKAARLLENLDDADRPSEPI